jgi:beta-N-acetylhexosaminidase
MHKRASHFMQMPRRVGLVLAWLIGLALVFAAVNKNDPYLISLRGAGNIVIVVGSLLVVALQVRRGVWRRGWRGRLLLLLWVLPSLSMLGAETSFEVRKWRVLNTDVARAQLLGRHFVVGYTSFDEVARLAEKGVTVRVRKGRIRICPHWYNTSAEVRAFLAILQAILIGKA